ncbi:mitotic interactor and substrate of PLK1 isoform 1-T1 [Anomaloglossus baeobatrachus]|uniref:mitotic interactor and substrate of PLK1 isoform X1 n=1 Tax=Anomaloglossus baeobatrachus TaxID=238106 RepID=UPI003F4F85C9
MFKYPSPWQVLCSSLEKREQVPENEKDGSAFITTAVEENTIEQYATDSTPFHILTLTECQTTDKIAPTLQETSINANVSEGLHITDTQTNTVTSESTMDRVTRRVFSSSSSKSINGSQLDLSNYPDEIQAKETIIQRRDVMTSPPDRHLKVLREEERFEIRSHHPETSPAKLFVDSDGDEEDKARPRSREFTPEKVLELEKNRKDIIKKQGQRKSLDTEDVIRISIKNGSVSNIDITGVEGDQNKPNINTEQIHFESARQQFLKLEKERNSLPITPRPQARPLRLITHSLHENYDLPREQEDQEGKPFGDERILNQDMNSRLPSDHFFKALPVDNGAQEKLAQEIKTETESTPNPSDETPIEREIRLALQREESLRKERGIQSSGETKEIIEISSNRMVANSLDVVPSTKPKNRPLTSLYIQREIEKEVQREADLKTEGRVAGLYDKGSSQELDERRKLFEQPDEILVQPQGNSTKMMTKETTYNIKGDTSQADLVTDSDTNNWAELDSAQPYSVRMNWKPAPYNVYRNRRLSADNILDIKTPLTKSSEKESAKETIVLRKQNFHLQPLKLCLDVQDNDGEDEVDEKKGLREKYKRLRPSLSNIIEQEIQQTLERDRELQEERRNSGLPPLTIHNDNELNTPHNGYEIHGSSSLTSDVSNTSTPAPWKGTFGSKSTIYQSSSVPIFKQQECPKFQVSQSDGDKLKRHENRYAGIEQSDSVNTEIVESTRVNRHKNTMALRWEAGLYANEQSD